MMATGACRPEQLMRSCCSGIIAEDEDLHSPTDISEDSVEVKVRPIVALSKKNKRKLAEPRKLPPDVKAPAVKRSRRGPRVSAVTDFMPARPTMPSPFRPWSESRSADEPLSLVLRPAETPSPVACGAQPTVQPCATSMHRSSNVFTVESLIGGGEMDQVPLNVPTAQSNCTTNRANNSGAVQRNYKNMTRERRIEANARERTRVHTISAAFDTLRKTIPSYSHSQKLSKLSILRIACSYIVALSRVAGEDYSAEQDEPSISECVDSVTRTLHAEGKIRRRKDE